MRKKLKVFAVASIGGHWVQLLRIAKALEKEFDVVYMSTHEKCATMVEGRVYYSMNDFSRWDFYKMFPELLHSIYIICKEKPSIVITTGAAPGLVCLFAAKICGIRTVWIDSIANVEHISFSGRIASKFASRIYTCLLYTSPSPRDTR